MMKLITRIFNLVIAATAVVATVLLFSLAPLSFNSKVVVAVDTIAQAVPETDYTKNINAKELLGTDEIQVGVKFSMSFDDIKKAKEGDKKLMNERLLKENLDGVLDTLDKAIDVLADNTIRTSLKKTISEETKKQIANAKPDSIDKTPEQILELLDIGESYYKNFANALYNEANRKGSTVDSVSTVLLDQTGEILMKAEKSGFAQAGSFTEEQKQAVKNGLNTILTQLEIINEDGTLKPLSDLPYMYAIKYVQKELTGKVSANELKAKTNETTRQHSDRLLELYVFNLMPDAFYNTVKYISIGIIIAIYILAGIWIFLALYEVLAAIFPKTNLKVMKGFLIPLFTIGAILQIALGFVLTGVFKYVIPNNFDLSTFNIPVKQAILVPRTFALGTSIVVIVTIVLLFVNLILKSIAYGDEAE